MTRARPPIPAVPACHTWELPPLPQPCSSRVIAAWQAGRCAICADDRPLEMDHDHESPTGDIRGQLCQRCNLSEGQSWSEQYPAFGLYRARPPAMLLGVLERYRGAPHPVPADAEAAFRTALSDAWELERGGGSIAEPDEQHDCGPRWTALFAERRQPQWSPLARAVHRVGLTRDEWAATLDVREMWQRAQRVHMSSETDPPTDACRPDRPWTPIRHNGPLMRACADCFTLDRERILAIVGPDGRGPVFDYEAERVREANRWRRNPTTPQPFLGC